MFLHHRAEVNLGPSSRDQGIWAMTRAVTRGQVADRRSLRAFHRRDPRRQPSGNRGLFHPMIAGGKFTRPGGE